MSLRQLTLPLVVAGLAAAGAGAQQLACFPSDHASRSGSTYERNLPLTYGISRVQMIYEKWDLAIPVGNRIVEVGFRQDESRTSTGYALQLEIWMGGTDLGMLTAGSNFANNYSNGTPTTRVFGPSIVQLPDLTGTTTPQEFFITLDTPYTVADENLVVEYRVLANSNANLAFNYYIDRASYATDVTTLGTGCQSSAGSVPLLSGSTSSYIGGNVSMSLSRAPANSQIWFNMALTPTTPVDLTPFGAPGCTAYVFPNVILGARGTTSGTASLSFPVVEEPLFVGVHIYAQVLVYDLFANPLGFVASNGIDIRPGIEPHMTVVYAAGNATATTGSVSRRRGVVSLFHHQ
ncbi:MAG: hypothetical protein IPM29_09560 [Planctomycetes bacterium]|nr:hypothetical protein [Planctomycetota bacterium]